MARYDRDMPDGGGDLGFYTSLGQEGEKGKTIAEQNAADAAARAAQVAPKVAIDDSYYTKKDSQGKTQAQRDAFKNALDTAATIRETSTNKSAYVDPKTGKVVTMAKGIVPTPVPIPTQTTTQVPTQTTTTSTNTATLKTAAQIATETKAAEDKAGRQSAYDLLYSQFKLYGLESLVEPLKGLITSGASPSEFTIKLRDSDAYKKRFSANAQRIAKGLRSLSEAEYIQLEDQYQDVMRRYGLPDTYYSRGEMGIQEGFNKFLEGDVSPVELEDRISTAQKRVLNANPEVLASLKEFYPDISNADILAYTLDPKNAIENIKRKVTSAEIGGAAMQAGLKTGMTRAEELAAAGITKQQAQTGFQTVAEVAPRGGQLAEIYKQSPYTQTTAEAEVFGLAGSVDAAKQRKKLTQLETAAFSGSAGAGAIARDRAGVL